jgi:Delta7-sterol 5-desaturase
MNTIADLLGQLRNTPVAIQWLIFFAENILITLGILFIGEWMRRRQDKNTPFFHYSSYDWLFCLVTNVLNTVITFAGFWLWERGFIKITFGRDYHIVLDFFVMFLAMDLLMYLFHFGIHKTFLYKTMHSLHHQSIDPQPIDLFVLHPVETLGFGFLWLFVLMILPLNALAIIAYLIINVIFGMVGHLGFEPLPGSFTGNKIGRYLGTSTFHHDHHKHVQYNYGFYTNIWDKLFGTFKKP